MDSKLLIEILDRLLGHIDSRGESEYDETSMNNLEELDEFLNEIINKLIKNLWDKNRKESSVQEIVNKSDRILYNLYMNLKDMYEVEE